MWEWGWGRERGEEMVMDVESRSEVGKGWMRGGCDAPRSGKIGKVQGYTGVWYLGPARRQGRRRQAGVFELANLGAGWKERYPVTALRSNGWMDE
jgi:hypothetical protein